jgi:hypothetical protein
MKYSINLLVNTIFCSAVLYASSAVANPNITAAEKALPACQGMPDAVIWTNCFGMFSSANGVTYTGEFLDGKQAGIGILEMTNGDKYLGQFRNGLLDGKGAYVWRDGSRHVGNFRDGKFNGVGINYRQDGVIAVAGLWRNDDLIRQETIEASVYPFTQDESFSKFLEIYKLATTETKRANPSDKPRSSAQKKNNKRYCFISAEKFEPNSCEIDQIRAKGYFGQIMISEFIGKDKVKHTIYPNERTSAMYPGTLNVITVTPIFLRDKQSFVESRGENCFIQGKFVETAAKIEKTEELISGHGCDQTQKQIFEMFRGQVSTYKKIQY